MPVKATAPMDKVRQLQRKLYVSAKKSKTGRFHALYERIHDWEVLVESWKRVRAKGGTGGVDEETIKTIEAQGFEAFLRGIQTCLKEGRSHPMPVRRVEIDKQDGTKRPLGIPTLAKSHNYVLDADIRRYFDRSDHEKLMAAVMRRISDRKVLKLIRKWLKAGVMVDGSLQDSLVGTPQGGVISPLPANIFLHEMDEKWEENHSALGVLIRYCDDFVILAKTWSAINEAKVRVLKILRGLSLELHPGKTRTVNMAWGYGSFCFLGHQLKKCCSERFRPVLRGWSNYFRSGNAARKFQRVEKYPWQRLVVFENRRRGKKSHHWKQRHHNHEWFRSLGLYSLTGIIRYPGESISYA